LDVEQEDLKSPVEDRRIDQAAHHVVGWVLRGQRVPSAWVDCALTLTLTMWQPLGQMEAVSETHHNHGTDPLVEHDCRIHCDMHPVRKVALLALQCRCHGGPVLGVNRGICPDSFEEGIDVEVVILSGIVGRAQGGCRTDYAEHSQESEEQTQLDWLCRDEREVMICVKLQWSLDLTLGVMVTSASNYHLCMDFCALLVEVESDFEDDSHHARYL
jgi:hypothetical protein